MVDRHRQIIAFITLTLYGLMVIHSFVPHIHHDHSSDLAHHHSDHSHHDHHAHEHDYDGKGFDDFMLFLLNHHAHLDDIQINEFKSGELVKIIHAQVTDLEFVLDEFSDLNVKEQPYKVYKPPSSKKHYCSSHSHRGPPALG